MQIDVTKLLTHYTDVIEINQEINIPKELLELSLITNLKDLNFEGELFLDEEDNFNLTGNLTGIMVLRDDITLDPVEYKFNAEIEEILKKNKNILDITDILWQNILVEVPSKVRSTDEDINLEGDGWRVISEEQFIKERNNSNNPFAKLDELINTKEDR